MANSKKNREEIIQIEEVEGLEGSFGFIILLHGKLILGFPFRFLSLEDEDNNIKATANYSSPHHSTCQLHQNRHRSKQRPDGCRRPGIAGRRRRLFWRRRHARIAGQNRGDCAVQRGGRGVGGRHLGRHAGGRVLDGLQPAHPQAGPAAQQGAHDLRGRQRHRTQVAEADLDRLHQPKVFERIAAECDWVVEEPAETEAFEGLPTAQMLRV